MITKDKEKTKIKGCACYGANSIHPCYCIPSSNKKSTKFKTKNK